MTDEATKFVREVRRIAERAQRQCTLRMYEVIAGRRRFVVLGYWLTLLGFKPRFRGQRIPKSTSQCVEFLVDAMGKSAIETAETISRLKIPQATDDMKRMFENIEQIAGAATNQDQQRTQTDEHDHSS